MIAEGKRIEVPSFHTLAKIRIFKSIWLNINNDFSTFILINEFMIIIKLKYFCRVILLH